MRRLCGRGQLLGRRDVETSTPSVRKPGSTLETLPRLRVNSAAHSSSTVHPNTCATTSACRTRWCPAESSFLSAATRSVRAARRAGDSPNRMAVRLASGAGIGEHAPVGAEIEIHRERKIAGGVLRQTGEPQRQQHACRRRRSKRGAKLSVSNCRIRRARPAPSASRIAVSRRRRCRPSEKQSGDVGAREQQHESRGDRQQADEREQRQRRAADPAERVESLRPVDGRSRRIVRSPPGTRPSAVRRRQRLRIAHHPRRLRRRAVRMLRNVAGGDRRLRRARRLEIGVQKSRPSPGGARPRNFAGMTPRISFGSPFSLTTRPTTAGSLEKRVRHSRSLMTTMSVRVSDGRKVRPRAAVGRRAP